MANSDPMDTMTAKLLEAQGEVSCLKAAVAKYGGHTDGCNFWNGHHEPGRCSCGLDDLLVQIGPVETHKDTSHAT